MASDSGAFRLLGLYRAQWGPTHRTPARELHRSEGFIVRKHNQAWEHKSCV